jgi:hypothetical protein
MRKLMISALVAILALPAAASQAMPARSNTGLDVIRMALTSFLEHPRHGAPTMYFGAGLSWGLGDDQAFVGQGPCQRREHRGHKYWSCRASARGVRVLPTGYYMDPLLQTAHIEVSRGGFEHSVDWTGRGKPEISYGGTLGNAVVFAFNNARATGKLFGHRFSPRSAHAVSFLGEFAFASVVAPGLDVHVDDDGVMHVHALVPARSAR